MHVNDETTDDITKKQKFYSVMFPNYDDLDDFSSLIKSEKSMFARKLDAELPYSSNIIEIDAELDSCLTFYQDTIELL